MPLQLLASPFTWVILLQAENKSPLCSQHRVIKNYYQEIFCYCTLSDQSASYFNYAAAEKEF